MAGGPQIPEQSADLHSRQRADVAPLHRPCPRCHRHGPRPSCWSPSLTLPARCTHHPPPAIPSTRALPPQVKAEEWEAIPDIGDYTIKRQKRETFAPAPDSLLAAAANAAGASGTTNAVGLDGLATPAGSASSLTDMGAHEWAWSSAWLWAIA